ncbi:MAG: PAS domain-containing protein [Pseudomonadota bacterium]
MLTDTECRLIVDQGPFMVWRSDASGACDFFNQHWLEFTGRSLAQELGDGWAQGVHPEDLDRCLATYRDHFARRAPFVMSYRLRRHDGQHRQLLDRGAPCHDERGVFQGFVGSCYDVTDQTSAREDLDRFFNLSQDPMCIASLDGYFKRVNPAFSRVLGYPEAELMARPWLDLVLDEDRAITIAAGQALAAGHSVHQFQNRYRCADGSVKWLSWSSQPVQDQGKIYAVARDVTRHKLAEQRLRKSERRLAEAQRIVRMGSWEWDVQNSEATWSEETYRILGLAPGGPSVPLDQFIAEWVHPEDRPAAAEVVSRAKEHGEGFDLTYRLLWPDGRVSWARSQGEARRDAGGRVVRLMGTMQDVTESHLAQERLRESERRLAEAQRIARLGSWEWDLAANRKTWSAELYRIFDLDPGCAPPTVEELARLIHPDDRQAWRDALQWALDGHGPYETVVRIQRRDGELRHVRIQGELARDALGRPSRMQGTGQDITADMRAEQRLRDNQRRLAEAQRIARMGSWEWDIAAGREHWSAEMFRLVGREPQEGPVPLPEVLSTIHPEDRQWLEERIRAALEQGEPYDVVHRGMRADGQVRVFRSQAEVVRDAAGKPLAMLGTALDITEQREAQDQLLLAAKVFENSIEGVIITDGEGRIQSVNRAFTIITGYSPEDVLGRRPGVLDPARDERPSHGRIRQSLLANGEWRGEINNRGKDGQVYPQWLTITAVRDERGRTVNYIMLLHDISDLKRSEEELKYLAHYDPLSGLPNRQLLRDRLEVALARAERHQLPLAVLYVDLDNFKTVNDSLGHAVGDLLLQSVANRLVDAHQGRDTVARLGGDDFVVVLEEINDAAQAEQAAAAILESLARPHRIEDEDLYLTTSVGLALYPDHGARPEVLVKNAEVAMYRAKGAGKNLFLAYDRSMDDQVHKRLSLENALRKALERQEFVVHYQPRLDVAGGRILGMEALVRWQRPESGLVPPGDFIPIAEETGLIVPIGQWVLRRACTQAQAWVAEGHSELVVAVNLSARQLLQANLLPMVESVLADTGLPPANLELEITESAIMSNVKRAVDTLHGLARLGVSLVLDDFGTGYSSLYYLKHFPIQALKIDQHFVADIFRDPDDAAIVEAIISLAQSLKLGVVAEGVETPEQMRYLLEHRCHQMQGYLFSRPVPAEAFAALLRRGPFPIPA